MECSEFLFFDGEISKVEAFKNMESSEFSFDGEIEAFRNLESFEFLSFDGEINKMEALRIFVCLVFFER